MGKHEYCLIITKFMEASSIPSERFDGYMIEGLLHLDLQGLHERVQGVHPGPGRVRRAHQRRRWSATSPRR